MQLIDTDVLVDYLRGDRASIKFLENAIEKSTCFTTAINVAELHAGVREGKEQPILDQFLALFEIISIDKKIACLGGLYRRDFGKSHGVGLADAIIAATAKLLNMQLVTLNRKHYPMLDKVHVPYKKNKN